MPPAANLKLSPKGFSRVVYSRYALMREGLMKILKGGENTNSGQGADIETAHGINNFCVTIEPSQL